MRKSSTLAVAVTAFQILAAAMPSAAQGADGSERKGSRVWVERPWQIRYFIRGEDLSSIQVSIRLALKKNADPKLLDGLYEGWFQPAVDIKLPTSLDERMAAVVIEFDRYGFVTTANSHPGRLRGRLNRLLYITLSAGDGPQDRQYDLGQWFQGFHNGSEAWAPTLCMGDEMPSGGGRYEKDFQATYSQGSFGCREWGYQLYDPDRPYIDVTSYSRKTKSYPHGAYIREFIGWARFGDRKPVIGKHESTWLCLYDCPGGAQPGIIPDIKEWAAKNGWPVPKTPKKQPMFPDADFTK